MVKFEVFILNATVRNLTTLLFYSTRTTRDYHRLAVERNFEEYRKETKNVVCFIFYYYLAFQLLQSSTDAS